MALHESPLQTLSAYADRTAMRRRMQRGPPRCEPSWQEIATQPDSGDTLERAPVNPHG
jgi:hypothetical protein